MITCRWVFVAAALLGCSGSSTPVEPGNPSGSAVRVVNGTPQPVVFFVVAADLAPLLDPIPETTVTESWVHVVAPGADRSIDSIPGREEAPNGGVAVYVYEVTSGGTRVRFSRVQMASGMEIRRSGGRIVIRPLES